MKPDPARAEAWLTTICRPVILFTLTGLVVARWFGWSSGTLSEAEVLKLWGAYEMALTAFQEASTVISENGRPLEDLQWHLGETLARLDRAGNCCFDILVPREYAGYLWEALLQNGKTHGLAPVGPAAAGNGAGQ